MFKTIGFLVCASGLIIAPHTPVQAQATRTFVSSFGSDTNDCSRSAPCRSFASAITKTNAGGEINTLDPGGYGVVTITKSISIVSGLGEAGILVPPGGIGVTINAHASDQINLRGLAIEGAGVGTTGIRFNTGGTLTVTNSVIRDMTDHGIDFEPTAASKIIVTDTLLSDSGRVGIYLYPQGASSLATAMFRRITASNNRWGIFANGASASTSTVKVSISDSAISLNDKFDGYGILATENTRMNIVNTEINQNRIGIGASSAVMYVVNSRALLNSFRGVDCSGSVFNSFGNNEFQDVNCSITTANPQ